MLRPTVTATALSVLLLAGCSPGDAGVAADPARPSTVPDTSTTTTAPSPPAQAPACPNPHGGTCLGPLEPGKYRTSTFRPRLTYTVPAGWTNLEDLPGNFWLFQQQDAQDGVLGGSYLGIYQNVRAAALNCHEAAQQDVGTTPAELVAWYESVPGLIVSEPERVKVGGLDGLQIDLALDRGVDTCHYGPYQGIPLIIGDGVSELHHVILRQIDVRLVMLRWRNGNVTLEITNVKEQHSADEFRAALQPIIESLHFDA